MQVLVLDECDMLLDGGFQRDIEAIVSALPASRQTLCFSATVPEKMLKVLAPTALARSVLYALCCLCLCCLLCSPAFVSPLARCSG